PTEQIVEDFALTHDRIDPLRERLLADAERRGVAREQFSRLLGATPDLIEPAIEHLHGTYGGAEAYLQRHGVAEATSRGSARSSRAADPRLRRPGGPADGPPRASPSADTERPFQNMLACERWRGQRSTTNRRWWPRRWSCSAGAATKAPRCATCSSTPASRAAASTPRSAARRRCSSRRCGPTRPWSVSSCTPSSPPPAACAPTCAPCSTTSSPSSSIPRTPPPSP